MRQSNQGNAYLLYCEPQPGHLSGHIVFILTQPGFIINNKNLHTLKNEDILYYFSMYPNPKPSQIKCLVKSFNVTTAVEPIMAPSYESDVLMRGNSRHRFNIKERTDLTTDEYYKQAESLQEPVRQQRFLIGQYTHALKLPDDFNQQAAIKVLDDIRTSRQWTAYAPGTKYVPCARDKKAKLAHNCSSALVDALRAGGMQTLPTFAITPANNKQRTAFWLVYSVLVMMRFSQLFSKELNAEKLLFIPMLYALIRFAMAASHSRDFYHMMRQMHPTPNKLPSALNYGLRTGLLLMNTSVSLLNPGAAEHFFNFPLQVYQAVSKQPDVEVIDIIKPDLSEATATLPETGTKLAQDITSNKGLHRRM